MRTGTYYDRDGRLVHVRRTATGYVIRRPGGETIVVGVRAHEDGKAMFRQNGSLVRMAAAR